ncbi:exodeoxyribonuclease III [Paenibacillus sp. CAA11]|uniref:endonuclease/exonuclease/phosphatase family protein n=1 Tax=Paenibacillus sp. CAA11 TaxID=1532905 RepID=UPI000D37FC39|nr:endonuclease/exonuclease/phosphatase family protein [Paenibacillus sp. CAA11]AWB43035.1 exodeoxyribonuclease III [Paenibacillus sp. CAA11]
MKLLTLNTHSWHETEQLEKIRQLADFILDQQVDVIALQEVNQSMEEAEAEPSVLSKFYAADPGVRIKQDNYALLLQQQLSDAYHWTWVPVHMAAGKYDEGVAILSKTPIKAAFSHYVSDMQLYDNFRTRKILGIKTTIKGQDTWFVSGHYGWWHDQAEPFLGQWVRTEIMLSRYKKEPLFILGDFNNAAEVRGEGYDYILGKGWHDLYKQAAVRDEGATVVKAIAGWENNQETLRIDYIFSNHPVKVKSSTVVMNGKNGAVVSDHFGVMAELG